MEWIKAEDKKPPYNFGVLVFIPEEDYHITSGMWDISNKWVLLDDYRIPDSEVTHWQTLPDVPEEFKQEIEQHGKVMQYLSELIKNDYIKLP